jgi:hypothetical protein
MRTHQVQFFVGNPTHLNFKYRNSKYVCSKYVYCTYD